MPIKIPSTLPARKVLEGENIFIMTEERAVGQDIRPLEIALLNLMPTKIATETQLSRLLGNTPLQVNLTLLQVSSHKAKNTSEEHMLAFYKTFEDVKDRNFDGFIITGAPVEQLPFEEVRMNQIKDAADFLNIELEDYIYYRHHDKRGIRSKMKVPVGYVPIKRVQQILSKKNHYSFDIEDRSLKTGDVKGESKVAAISEPETYALMAIGAERGLEELLGPRADNQEKKRQMYRQIARDGFCTLDSMESTRSSSTTINTLNTYLLAAGIRSDLITDTMQTEYTLNKNLRN